MMAGRMIVQAILPRSRGRVRTPRTSRRYVASPAFNSWLMPCGHSTLHDRESLLGEGVGAVVLSAATEGHGLFLHAGAANVDTYSVTSANPDGKSIADVHAAVFRQGGLSQPRRGFVASRHTGTAIAAERTPAKRRAFVSPLPMFRRCVP